MARASRAGPGRAGPGRGAGGSRWAGAGAARARASVDALYAPGARGVPGEYEADARVGTGGHHVRAVLLHAWPVVDEHERQRCRLEARTLLAERCACGGLDQLAIPAAILGARLLEGVVRGPDVVLPPGPIRATLGHDVAADQEEDDERREHDEDDCEHRHGQDCKSARKHGVNSRLKRKRAARSGRPGAEVIRRRPTLPGPRRPSTIGAEGLNCSVRNGKRCLPLAMTTEKGERPPA